MATQVHTDQSNSHTTYSDTASNSTAVLTPARVKKPVTETSPITLPASVQTATPQEKSVVSLIASLVVGGLVAFDDWLSGPATTERQRLESKLAETRREPYTRLAGF
ncbi:MAG: hypothetical protein ACE5Q6_18235 [Dehalococcoidia bacterium]